MSKWVHFMVFGYFCLAYTNYSQLTHNLGFRIPFHFCIDDQDLKEAFVALNYLWGKHVNTPDMGKWLFLNGIQLSLSESDA